MCFCTKWYLSKLRYIQKQNYIFVRYIQLSIFGENYFESGVKALHLMRRNYVRIGKPCKIGGFVISIVHFVIILAGPCACFSIILLSNKTITGQLTIQLINPVGPVLLTLITSWFVARVFTGALQTSLNTVLLSAACDEEMFTREQRFMEPDLLDFMDGIGEEQNEQHRENKNKVKLEFGYKNSSNGSFYTRDDTSKPYNNRVLPSREQWNETSANRSMRLGTYDIRSLNTERSEKYMGEIIEASLEEDIPQPGIGIQAKYIND